MACLEKSGPCGLQAGRSPLVLRAAKSKHRSGNSLTFLSGTVRVGVRHPILLMPVEMQPLRRGAPDSRVKPEPTPSNLESMT